MQEAVQLIQDPLASSPEDRPCTGKWSGSLRELSRRRSAHSLPRHPRVPASTAIGHAGELVLGSLKEAVDLAVMSGRFHLYEGYTPQQVVGGVRLFKAHGHRKTGSYECSGGIDVSYGKGAPGSDQRSNQSTRRESALRAER